MKKILLYVSCVLILGACMKNDPVLENRMDNGIVKVYDSANREFFTGYVEMSELNTQGVRFVAEKKNVVDGVNEGERTLYYPSGKIKLKEEYKNGLLNGKQIEYHGNGSVISERTYVKNVLNGPMMSNNFDGSKTVGEMRNGKYISKTVYFENGRTAAVENYDDDGNKHGMSTFYTLTGGILAKLPYEHGQLHGFVEDYRKEFDLSYPDFRGYMYHGKPDGNFYEYTTRPIKNPIISLNDYKESIKNKFTVNEENFDKNSYTVEYYPNGNIKSYGTEDGYSSLSYEENFDILKLLDSISKRSEYVKKAKTSDDLSSEYKYIEDMNDCILGWLLSENLNEKQKKDLETVSNAMKSYLVDIYVRKRIIAVE